MDEIKVEKHELIKQLNAAAAAVASVSNKISGAVLLRANEKNISVLANDYQTFVRVGLINDEEDYIEATVNYKTLLEVAKSMGNIVAIRKTVNNLILESGNDRIYIKNIDGEIDTEPPFGGETVGSFYVNTELWNDAISRASIAAAINNPYVRKVLTGIHVRVESNTAIIEAVDGVNAARIYVPVRSVMLSDPGHNIDFIYPAITAVKLAKIAKPDNPDQDEMLVRVFSHSVDFTAGDVFAATLLLNTEADYPNLDALFQSSFKREIVVDRKRLSAALRRALLFADDSNAGYIKVSDIGEIIVGSSDAINEKDSKGSTLETIPAVVNTNESYLIWFNFYRLNNIIKKVRSDMIKIECNEPDSPVRISGAGKNDPLTALIMPINLNPAYQS